MKYIDKDNLSDYAFLNEDTLVYPLRAVCVSFHGYTDGTRHNKSNEMARRLGERGIAWVFPYYSVWAWMSRSSMEFNEQVLDAVYEKLNAGGEIPLIVSGGSMGGLTALNYLIYGKRRAIGCAVNCPVTDVFRMFDDNPACRAAILSAHIEKEGELDEILKSHSPVHFAAKLPRIPYLFVYGGKDEYFTQKQRPAMQKALDEEGIAHQMLVQPQMAHCDMNPYPDAFNKYCDFLIGLPSLR